MWLHPGGAGQVPRLSFRLVHPDCSNWQPVRADVTRPRQAGKRLRASGKIALIARLTKRVYIN
jgi:hypothetical protein